MSGKHATLSASGSAKWLACPGALALESQIDITDEDTKESIEGTAAHFLGEHCLSNNMEPRNFHGWFIQVDPKEGNHTIKQSWKTFDLCTVKVDDDMINAVEVYVEYVERLQPKNKFIEQQVDYSHLAPGGFGTSDYIAEVHEKVADGKKVNTMYVVDYKHGKGIRVDAYENSQGKLYALGALNTLDMLFDRPIERIVIVIVQPRMDNISEFEISIDDLLAWGESIKPKAKLAHDLREKVKNGGQIPEGCFNPTEKGCQWCKGKRTKTCKALAQQGYSAAVEGFDDMTVEQKADLPSVKVTGDTIKDPMLMDSADLAACYKALGVFMKFANELDEEIRSRINAGETVPGLKLVPTEGNRAWSVDEDEAIKAMRTAGLVKEDYEKISIISPTEAEKKLKAARPKDYTRRYKKLQLAAIHRPAGKDKIVEDKSVKAEDFDDLLN